MKSLSISHRFHLLNIKKIWVGQKKRISFYRRLVDEKFCLKTVSIRIDRRRCVKKNFDENFQMRNFTTIETTITNKTNSTRLCKINKRNFTVFQILSTIRILKRRPSVNKIFYEHRVHRECDTFGCSRARLNAPKRQKPWRKIESSSFESQSFYFGSVQNKSFSLHSKTSLTEHSSYMICSLYATLSCPAEQLSLVSTFSYVICTINSQQCEQFCVLPINGQTEMFKWLYTWTRRFC